MRLLIIEDNQRLCQAVAASLRAQGFAVDTAASASEGLRVWRAADYDAAVLDLMLPDGAGLDALEQLLCLARLDSQEQFQFAAFDAHAVALEVARELAPVALESEHYVTAATPDASVPAHGNATLTRLVFRNLIENAIQYTPAGTSITLSADSATVIIADDGPGISAHAAASLFERFRRGPNASGPGAGLGLAIAKCIMERQGGRLSLDANAARGARFVMAFPEPM